MAVKLSSKLDQHVSEARIEIIPLIDIMFFLLATFMLVSLSMVNLKSIKVNLPTATVADTDTKRDLVDISINKSGGFYLDKTPVASNELATKLAAMRNGKPNLRVFISADRDCRYGDVRHVLGLVRSAGIDKVGFEIREQPDEAAR